MKALRFVALRLLGMIFVLLVITALTYATFYLLPSDPAQLSCGRPCTPDSLARAREYMGFDEPGWQQYLHFLSGIVRGRSYGEGSAALHCAAPCLGYSFRLDQPVTQLILSRAPITFSIALGASALWLVLGVGVGVIAAVKRGSVFDRAAMTFAVFGVSVPAYLLGLLGILLFGFTLNMVPVSGYVPLTSDPVGWVWHLVLPWCVLALIHAAFYARLTRGQMLDVLSEDYIRTARSKGLTERVVVGKHALRNVLIPVITLLGVHLGELLSGAIITERVFSMQGLGSLFLEAVGTVDLPLIVGVALIAAFFVIFANFVVDVAYGLLDPRVSQ